MIALIFAAAVAVAGSQPCPQVFAGAVAPTVAAEEVCFQGFAVGYRAAWGEPVWSAEVLTPASVHAGEAAKRNGAFHVCAELPKAEEISPDVYAKSGYDLGHMTPAGDRGADKPETFGTCNMVPQKPNLNRKIWAGIEASLRNLATAGATVYVVTGPEVLPGAQTLGGKVAIPAKTWKAVWVVGHGAEAWDCTNTDTPDCEQETVEALASEIGFDPLPGIDRALEAVAYHLAAPTKGVAP
jgi:endonuclease G